MHLHDNYIQVEDSGGLPRAGALLYFYQTGTTSPLTIYTDYAGATPQANPVVADANGVFAPVYVSPLQYKVVLKTSAGVTLQTVDPVTGGGGGLPATSTDNAIARYDGTTGSLQNSVVTVADTTGQIGMPSGGGFNWNGGNLVVTHSAGLLTSTGSLYIDHASDAQFTLDKGASGDISRIIAKKGGTERWVLNLGNATAESGSDAGSDFSIGRYNDAGTFQDSPIFIPRASGVIQLQVGQVNFPAVQNPSTNANTLDDYEEGTWTPELTFATPGNLVTAWSTQVGWYIKKGKEVTLGFSMVSSTFTHTTASGAASITGNPFTSANVTGQIPTCYVEFSGITLAANIINARLGSNTTVLNLLGSASGSANTTIGTGQMPTGGTVILRGVLVFTASA